MTPDEYRALAARVETEAPSLELQEAIAETMVWTRAEQIHRWFDPHRNTICSLDPWLTSIDAAAAPMPEGWDWSVEYRPRQNVYLAIARRPGDYRESLSTTEPQARTALALRCKAADLEARGDD